MVLDNCDWNKPGFNPYTGSVVQAIESYSDIDNESKAILIKAVKENKYDRVLISKTGIFSLSENEYTPEITGMHFGKNHRCNKIDRTQWNNWHFEPAKVYESPGATIVIPDVCNNVSRITRIPPRKDIPYVPFTVHQVPEPWTFPLTLAIAAYFTFYDKRKRSTNAL